MAQYKRILLKLSGESLMGGKQYGIDEVRLNEYAAQIKEIAEMGVQIGIVIGGGNIFRGLSGASKGFDRVKGDQMGMLATVINSLALSSALVAQGVKAKVLTAIRMEPIGEFYNKWRAIELLEQGNVVIMSGGTGNPFFTTDTGSSLRGIEIEADVMLKGTRVDGIYTADPEKDLTATKFSDITYDEIYTRGLKVMAPTQVTMFYRVISSLAARYKFGLSATVRRSDGLIKTTFAILGDIAYQVPDEAVKDKTIQVRILRRDTGVLTDRSCLDTDGTLVYSSLLSYLVGNHNRNELIGADLTYNSDHYNLVLSDRLEHLRALRELLPDKLRAVSAMIDGSMTSKRARAEREQAIEDMRAGRKHYLFASYALAKEGLDIPRLDRLYMVTPKKDYSVVTQSIGRIARVFDGKEDAVCYDYVDDIQFCENQWKRRRAHYRKARCIL